MGYTHYWERPFAIDIDDFRTIRADFERLILPLNDIGVALAGPSGKDMPIITDELIAFNGLANCGHAKNDEIVIPYPAADASGIGSSATAIDEEASDFLVRIRHRCCNGRCSCEAFSFARVLRAEHAFQNKDSGLFVEGLKTAFRPYDIGATAFLLIAKRFLGDRLQVFSDGADTQWTDAKRLCQSVLGYGEWFGIVEEKVEEDEPAADGVAQKRKVTLRKLVGTAGITV